MRRLQIGPQLRVVSHTADGVVLEGIARLRPGQSIDLVLDAAPGVAGLVRRVLVQSWMVARLGSDGPLYAGQCRWE